jgi:hypothetical protein
VGEYSLDVLSATVRGGVPLEMVMALMREHGDVLTQQCRTCLGEGLTEDVTLQVSITARQVSLQYQPETALRI